MTLRSFAASATFRFVLPSSLLHATSLGWLMTGSWVTPRLPEPVHVVELAALPPPPPEPPPPEPEPEPEPEPASAAAEPTPPPSTPRTPPPAAKVAEASEPVAPLRLGAVALSNFGLAVGSAAPAAIAPAVARAPAPPKPQPVSKPAAPEVVPMRDLSRRPIAPSFDGQLRRNYPSALRRQGVEGEALVRLTLAADGSVRGVSPLSSSHPEFAEACRRTLLGSRWSAPLDQQGRPVPTQLTYRCRFQVAF